MARFSVLSAGAFVLPGPPANHPYSSSVLLKRGQIAEVTSATRRARTRSTKPTEESNSSLRRCRDPKDEARSRKREYTASWKPVLPGSRLDIPLVFFGIWGSLPADDVAEAVSFVRAQRAKIYPR